MKLKLRENPHEWRKFTLVWCAVIPLVSYLLLRKQVISAPAFQILLIVFGVTAIFALIIPRLFRGFYRAGMTVSFHIGQFAGKVILTLFFFLLLTPMAILLRVLGKDLLQLKRHGSAPSYWTPARKTGQFDQQY